MSQALNSVFLYFSEKKWSEARNSGPDIGTPGRVVGADGKVRAFQYTDQSSKPDSSLGELVYEGPMDQVEDPRENGWPTGPHVLIA